MNHAREPDQSTKESSRIKLHIDWIGSGTSGFIWCWVFTVRGRVKRHQCLRTSSHAFWFKDSEVIQHFGNCFLNSRWVKAKLLCIEENPSV